MSKFFTILTKVGEAKLANATALGQTVQFEKLAVGDGNGVLPTPDQNQTALVNQVRREPLNSVEIDPNNPNWIICEQIIPEDVGGWTIREVGIYDVDGDLIAVGNFPETYKPILEEGSGRTQTVRIVLQVSSSSSVELKIDPSIVLATREYVDNSQKKQNLLMQFLPYDAERIYSVGEVCYTKDQATNELSYWQWYSNVESLAGKSPLLDANRHVGWSDNTKPFYWVPYTGDQVGMPFYWLDTSAPEWAVMEINVDLPIAVYWRLARRYPDLVNGSVINTGEIRAEFLRVLDQGRGVDSSRTINEHQDYMTAIPNGVMVRVGNFNHNDGTVDHNGSSETKNVNDLAPAPWGDSASRYYETRPSNVARPMAIAI